MEAGAKGRLRISEYRLIARRARGCRVPADRSILVHLTPGVLVSRRWGRDGGIPGRCRQQCPSGGDALFVLARFGHIRREREKKQTNKQKTKAHAYTIRPPKGDKGRRGEKAPSAKERRVRGESHGIKKSCAREGGERVETRGRFLHVGNFVFLFVYCGLRKLKRKWENEIKVMRMTERRGFCGKGK